MTPSPSKIIGHRGAAASAPENTLAALRYAADHGIKWVEIDVMATADNQLIIHHDLTLGRCNNGAGKVCETTLGDIRELDAGSWFGAQFSGEKVPTLAEALDLITARGMGLNLEIKAPEGQGAATAELVARHLERQPAPVPELLISSFNPEALDQIHAMAPHFALGVLSDPVPEDWQARLGAISAFSLHCEAPFIAKADIEAVHAAGYRMLTYTVNDANEAKRLLDMGIDGVISDGPDRLAAALGL